VAKGNSTTNVHLKPIAGVEVVGHDVFFRKGGPSRATAIASGGSQMDKKSSVDKKIELYRRLQKANQEELERRKQIHQKKVAKIKARKGVQRPLAILAHGDSWFDYPLNGNAPTGWTDIIEHLRYMGNPPPFILNISQWGDTSTNEMSWPKQKMIDALKDKSNWFGGKPDAILFSSGGNDVAGNQFCLFLEDAPGGLDINSFAKVEGMVSVSYEALFKLRDKRASGVPIFGHCYDLLIPDGRKALCIGPWLLPSLEFVGHSQYDPLNTQIVHDAMKRFRLMLDGFQNHPTKNYNFILVETQGTLKNPNYKLDRANEAHPRKQGFKALAEKFVEALRLKFPGRI
jgi:hypothetical protein